MEEQARPGSAAPDPGLRQRSARGERRNTERSGQRPAAEPTPVVATRPDGSKLSRTAQRIEVATLELFNRFGEPNVSTTALSTDLNISPGNLYYHYPSKDALVNALFDRYAAALEDLLPAADEVRHVEDAWLFFHMLFELIWTYRFVYRDLNDLLSRNRHIEQRFKVLLERKGVAIRAVLRGLAAGGAMQAAPEDTATSMVVVLTYWLSYEYVRAPREALEPAVAGAAMSRGAWHVLNLLAPWLEPAARDHLHQLAGQYGGR